MATAAGTTSLASLKWNNFLYILQFYRFLDLLVVLGPLPVEPVQEHLGKTQIVEHSCWSILVSQPLPNCLQVTFGDVLYGSFGQEQHFGVVTRIKFSLMLQIKLICFPTLVPCCTASKWRKCYAWAIPLSSLFLQKFCKTNSYLNKKDL